MALKKQKVELIEVVAPAVTECPATLAEAKALGKALDVWSSVDTQTGCTGLVVQLPKELDQVFDELMTVKDGIKELEILKTHLENRFRLAIGSASVGKLTDRHKLVYREMVYQPEKTIPAFKYKPVSFRNPPK